MAEFSGSGGAGGGNESTHSSTFPGDLNIFENDLIPIRFSQRTFTAKSLKVVLDGNGQNPPAGAPVIVEFYKVTLATTVEVLMGTVTVAIGTLQKEVALSPGVVITGGVHGTRAKITQIGSDVSAPGHSATFAVQGG